MNKYLTLIVLFCVFMSALSAQSNDGSQVTLSGYIKDADSGETLIGASAYISSISSGTTSNEYGFYSLTVPAGSYSIEFAYLGFDSKTVEIDLVRNITQDIELGEDIAELVEVVVTSEAEDKNITNTEMSVNKLDIRTITKMPYDLFNSCRGYLR